MKSGEESCGVIVEGGKVRRVIGLSESISIFAVRLVLC